MNNIINVKMTDVELANCMTFLDRVNLTGAEVEAFVSIKNALATASSAAKRNSVSPASNELD